MDHPKRRVDQTDPLDQNALAVHDIDELWPQSLTSSKASLVGINTVFSHLLQAVAGT